MRILNGSKVAFARIAAPPGVWLIRDTTNCDAGKRKKAGDRNRQSQLEKYENIQ